MSFWALKAAYWCHLFQDAILGMFYGAAIGDSLGILTEFMRPSEAEFYYDKENGESRT